MFIVIYCDVPLKRGCAKILKLPLVDIQFFNPGEDP